MYHVLNVKDVIVNRENIQCLARLCSARMCPNKLAANVQLDLFPECEDLLMWPRRVFRIYDLHKSYKCKKDKEPNEYQTFHVVDKLHATGTVT